MKVISRFNLHHSKLYHFFFAVLVVTYPIFCTSAQESLKIDSLKNTLEAVGEDKKVKIYLAFADEYEFRDPDKFSKYISLAVSLAKDLDDYEGLVASYMYFAKGEVSKFQYRIAKSYYDSVLLVSNENNYAKGKILAHRGLGDIFYYFRSFDKALSKYHEAVSLSDSSGYAGELSRIYREMAFTYGHLKQTDSALLYYDKATDVAKSMNEQIEIAKSYRGTGFFYESSDRAKSTQYYEMALEVFKSLRTKVEISSTNRSMGKNYRAMGDYSRSINHFIESLRIDEQIGNLRGISIASNSIGIIFYEQKNYLKALEYYKVYLEASKAQKRETSVATACNNIALVYYHLQNFEEAEYYYTKCLEIAEKLSHTSLLGWAYNGMGLLRQDQFRLVEAKEWLEKAIYVRSILNRKRYLGQSHNSLGKNYLLQKNYKQALTQFLLASEIAKSESDALNYKDALEGLSAVYEHQGNVGKSLESYKLFKFMADSLINQENTRMLTRLEAEYEFEKERQLITAEQAKKDLEFQQEIDKQEWIKYSVIVVASFLAIIAFISYRSYKRKRADNLLLEDKNENMKELRIREQQLSAEALSARERELATMAMSSHEKNSLLQDLEHKVSFLETRLDDSVKLDLKEMRKTISNSYSLDKSWDSFLHKFEGVHPHFFDKLKEENPNLTINDLKLSAYLKIGMSNKEIANVTHLTVGSVKSSINRLKKKLKMHAEDSIRDFVLKYA